MNDETQKNISKYIKSFSPNRYKKKSDDAEYLSHFNEKLKINLEKFLQIANSKKYEKFMLEIGCGCGDFIVNYAKNNKQTFCTGIDAYKGGIITTTRKVLANNLENISLLNDDARLFIDNLNEFEWNEIFILFPDPWPKKRHHKRRLLTREYITFLLTKIKKDGQIIIATDDTSYQDFIKEQLAELDHIVKKEEDVFDLIHYYEKTKYHSKAISDRRFTLFFKIAKK